MGIFTRRRHESGTVQLYTSPGCPDCAAVKRWLDTHTVDYREIDLSDPVVSNMVKEKYGVRVAPITVVGKEVLYGTYDRQRPRLEALLGTQAH